MSKFKASFGYAVKGIVHAFAKERNMKIHGAALFLIIIAGLLFNITAAEWLVIILISALVIGLELINTAVESLVDLVTDEYRPLAAIAKNVAAGAVLFCAFAAVIIGLIIFLPYIGGLF